MNEKEELDLEKYLARGVTNIVKDICKSFFKNRKTIRFMAGFAQASKIATKKRHKLELLGEHIPPFLIVSITCSCNLHCSGCYARANNECFEGDTFERKILNSEEWGSVFREAEEIGISFIILAGGEPLLRPDVLNEAGRHRKILFPVFTNGILIHGKLLDLFESNPNLLPVISIEGDKEATNKRRGNGVYEKIDVAMNDLYSRSISFGVSITVTKLNIKLVLDCAFIEELQDKGCRAFVYVEYVPVDENTYTIAPDDIDRDLIRQRLNLLRKEKEDVLFISFPGDEKASGGCLAAGRGFFHVNAFGFAEPCPFSAYSDTNVRESGIRKALNSPLFCALNKKGIMNADHVGGCVLFEKKELVSELCEREKNDNKGKNY